MSASRILIAATGSGVGKTTIACALLRALQWRGLRVRACKCGPDFIDPQFHRAVIGIPSQNLDLFLGGEELVRDLVARGSEDFDLTLIEGAMGYYDGIAQSVEASAYHIAWVTQTPVALVVDARGRALSVAAEVAGFAYFREPSYVAGVILNNASASYYSQLKAMIEHEVGVPVLGYVPQLQNVGLQSRHLGLVEPDEVPELQAKLDALADVVEKTVDMDGLLGLARSAEPLRSETCVEERPSHPTTAHAPVIAVARDEAFSFYYEDALELLERLGAKLEFFSPLRDEELPLGASGLYLGGGYPELHAQELSSNASMLAAIRAAATGGMPTIAECGGFLYLHKTLEDKNGTPWPMAGALEARAIKGNRLRRFGYVTLTARHDGLLAKKGQTLPAHEFHYWESSDSGEGFHAQKPQSTRGWDCVVSTPSLYAGFPHLYLPGRPQAAKRFVEACAAYGAARGVC